MNEHKNKILNGLIKKLKNGETAAIDKIMLLKYRDLFLIAFSYLKDKMLAEDIVSETFIMLIEKAHTIKNEKNLNGYLSTVVANKSIDLLRKRKRELYRDNEYIENKQDGILTPDQNMVRFVLSQMDTNERTVLMLWNFKYTLKEVSVKTGFTINQVRLLLKKAKENFLNIYSKTNED